MKNPAEFSPDDVVAVATIVADPDEWCQRDCGAAFYNPDRCRHCRAPCEGQKTQHKPDCPVLKAEDLLTGSEVEFDYRWHDHG